MTHETVERTFTVPSPTHLTVNNIVGVVLITPGESGQISVTAVKHTDTGNAERTRLELEQAEDGRVTIAARFDPDLMFFFWNHQPCRVDFIIQMPPTACVVTAHGVSNSLDIRGLQGEFDVHTVSGDVTLHDLTGKLQVNSVSGDVLGERVLLSAPLEVKTVSGEVRFPESRIPVVRGNTVSGDVLLVTSLVEGPYDFSSVSGDVTLWFPATTACVVELNSMSGEIYTELVVTNESTSIGSQRLEVNGGGSTVRLRSVSGGLGVLRATGEETSSTPTSRQEILERVERGELSVEDALQQLA